jgi:hypothetical protein
VFHAHLHVIPRFADEPLAGRGIRYALKQPTNRRGVEQNLNQPSPGATTTGTYHVGAALEWRPRTDASPRGEASD